MSVKLIYNIIVYAIMTISLLINIISIRECSIQQQLKNVTAPQQQTFNEHIKQFYKSRGEYNEHKKEIDQINSPDDFINFIIQLPDFKPPGNGVIPATSE